MRVIDFADIPSHNFQILSKILLRDANYKVSILPKLSTKSLIVYLIIALLTEVEAR